MSASVVSSGSQLCNVKAITGATNATPVVVTTATHGFSNGDRIAIADCDVPALNGIWTIANVTGTTFELVGTTAPGAAATTGTCGRELIVYTTTALGIFVFQTNLAPMASGDEALMITSGKVASAGAFVDFKVDSYIGAQSLDLYQLNPPAVTPFSHRFSILQYKGTARTFEWAVLRVQ